MLPTHNPLVVTIFWMPIYIAIIMAIRILSHPRPEDIVPQWEFHKALHECVTMWGPLLFILQLIENILHGR